MASESVARQQQAAAADANANANGSINASGTDAQITVTHSQGRSATVSPSPVNGRQSPAPPPRVRRPAYLNASSPHQMSLRTLRLIGGHTDRVASSSESSSSEDESEESDRRRQRARMPRVGSFQPSGASRAASPMPDTRRVSHAVDAPAVSAFRQVSGAGRPADSDSSSSGDEEDAIIARWSALINHDRDLEDSEQQLAHHSTPPVGVGSFTGGMSESPRKRALARKNSTRSPTTVPPRASSHGASPAATTVPPNTSSHSVSVTTPTPAVVGPSETECSILCEDTTDNTITAHSHLNYATGSSKRFKWRTLMRRIPYYIPILSWVPRYDRSNLLGDLISGLSVGVMLVPQGLTYASLANLPPIYGLYSAFFPLLIYAIMGSSRHLSIGPEVTSSILVGKVGEGAAPTQRARRARERCSSSASFRAYDLTYLLEYLLFVLYRPFCLSLPSRPVPSLLPRWPPLSSPPPSHSPSSSA